MANIQGTLSPDLLNGTDDPDLIQGLARDDTLRGFGGADTLDGGSDGDSMAGGDGDDVYLVDNPRDVVLELDGEGVDEVQARVSFSLSRAAENLTLFGAAGISGTGNGLDNLIVGNSGGNVLAGRNGDDSLSGGGGNDSLFGGAGADSLYGGAGDDVYLVETADDVVSENARAGHDLVRSNIAYALGADLEDLVLLGNSAIDGAGNRLANHIRGNSAANSLSGAQGDDTLNGSAGADTLTGGKGSDTYIVDDPGDVVVESFDDPFEEVLASVSYTLAPNVEALFLLGGAAINGSGNDADNRIDGNGAANLLAGLDGNDNLVGGGGADTLDGGAGAEDFMSGGKGGDLYFVDGANDAVLEEAGEGIDVVHSSLSYTLRENVENLTLLGSADLWGSGNSLGNLIIGNDGANAINGGVGGGDTLFGGGGDDELFGSRGRDHLTGGSGADAFVYLSRLDSAVAAFDTVSDFESGLDVIDLSVIDPNRGSPVSAFEFIGTESFTRVGQLRVQQTAAGTLVQMNTDTDLDPDGQILLAGVTAEALTEADFIL